MTIEEMADEIATKANECCERRDGFAEEVEMLAMKYLNTAFKMGVEMSEKYSDNK